MLRVFWAAALGLALRPSAGLPSVPLRGTLGPFGQWIIELNVGLQGPFGVVLDTGSANLLLSSSRCTSCVPAAGAQAIAGRQLLDADRAESAHVFRPNVSASPAIAIYAGFGANCTWGIADVAVGPVISASTGAFVVDEMVVETSNQSEPGAVQIGYGIGTFAPVLGPTDRSLIFNVASGLIGAAGSNGGFCRMLSVINKCPSRPNLFEQVLGQDRPTTLPAPAFSMHLPPFHFGTPGVAGQLIFGGREHSLERQGPTVTVPRADFVPEMIEAYARGEGFVSLGKWFLLVDDVLINGLSTGACATNPFGKCLAFTDTGAPLVQVDNSMVPHSEAVKMDTWKRLYSVVPNSRWPIANCTSVLPSFPLNLTLRIDGVDFTTHTGDMQTADVGRDQCIARVQNGTLSSLFGPAADTPMYSFPAPLIYLGNPWLRNFYMTYKMPTGARGAPGSTNATITIGCAADSKGTCTDASVAQSGSEASHTKLSAADDAGIAIGVLLVLALFVMIGLYVKGARNRDRSSGSHGSGGPAGLLLDDFGGST